MSLCFSVRLHNPEQPCLFCDLRLVLFDTLLEFFGDWRVEGAAAGFQVVFLDCGDLGLASLDGSSVNHGKWSHCWRAIPGLVALVSGGLQRGDNPANTSVLADSDFF